MSTPPETSERPVKKITTTVDPFCNRCGKTRTTALVRMQHAFVWMCFPCQIRYLFAAWRAKHRRSRERAKKKQSL